MENRNKKIIILVSVLLVIAVAAVAFFIAGIKKCNDIKQSLIGKSFSGIASTFEDYKKVEGDTFYLVVEFLDKNTCNVTYVHFENDGRESYHGKDEHKNVSYSLSPSFGGVNFELSSPAPRTNNTFKVMVENEKIKISTDDFKNGLPLTMEEGLAWK